jgi:subtilisin family serine protease
MPGEYITTNSLNDNSSQKDGTSYSAALFTGLTALLKDKYPNYNQSQVMYMLRKMSSGKERNDLCGYGMQIFKD